MRGRIATALLLSSVLLMFTCSAMQTSTRERLWDEGPLSSRDFRLDSQPTRARSIGYVTRMCMGSRFRELFHFRFRNSTGSSLGLQILGVGAEAAFFSGVRG